MTVFSLFFWVSVVQHARDRARARKRANFCSRGLTVVQWVLWNLLGPLGFLADQVRTQLLRPDLRKPRRRPVMLEVVHTVLESFPFVLMLSFEVLGNQNFGFLYTFSLFVSYATSSWSLGLVASSTAFEEPEIPRTGRKFLMFTGLVTLNAGFMAPSIMRVGLFGGAFGSWVFFLVPVGEVFLNLVILTTGVMLANPGALCRCLSAHGCKETCFSVFIFSGICFLSALGVVEHPFWMILVCVCVCVCVCSFRLWSAVVGDMRE